jgi:PPOX class probable F420-dependent enzyme
VKVRTPSSSREDRGMRLDAVTCRERFTEARSAYLATTGNDLLPHLVPVTFALVGDDVVFAIDGKPKTTTHLRRLRNIGENPRVALLTDHYDDDWTRLWWVRVDGAATVEPEGPARTGALDELAAKYPQYSADRPQGSVVRVRIDRWTGWSFTAR